MPSVVFHHPTDTLEAPDANIYNTAGAGGKSTSRCPSQGEYQRLLPHLEPIDLIFGEVIYDPGQLIRHVYFPNRGMISLLSAVSDQSTLEVGIVGNEGMAGIPLFLRVKRSRGRTLVQGAGTAMRMKASEMRKSSNHGSRLNRLLRLYTHALLIQVSQSAACNQFHRVEARLARWLLMTRDLMAADEFRLTQDFLSNMLGVRREGVSKAAGALRQQNLISYSRGNITILNRRGLEALSCQCYRIIREEYECFLN